jgi:hypothetical protein
MPLIIVSYYGVIPPEELIDGAKIPVGFGLILLTLFVRKFAELDVCPPNAAGLRWHNHASVSPDY